MNRTGGGRSARWCATAAAVLLAVACGHDGGAPVALAWHLTAMHADPHRSLGRGEGVIIAFIDTGFTTTALPAFAHRVLGGWNVVTGTVDDADVSGHGTEMAVLAAGGGDQGVWGTAPAATVLPVVVADMDGHATPGAVASGIRFARTHGAAVINISLAADVASPDVTDEIRAATSAGIAVVAAAGDLGRPGPEFPASAAGVIAVYGEDSSGQVGAHSNLPTVGGVLAPGEQIETTVPVGASARKLAINGTSAAAALVSGVIAACLSAAGPRYGTVQLRNARCTQLLLARDAGQFLDLKLITEAVK